MLQLMGDIARVEYSAKKRGMKPVIRLNGTTDVQWENFKILGKTIFEHFPKVRFVDYTKIARRMFSNKIKNLHLTFSKSEVNTEIAKTVAAAGHNVAVVFAKDKPKTLWGRKVIDGDLHDIRFLDKKGVIVGLKAKGRALKDKTGFVYVS